MELLIELISAFDRKMPHYRPSLVYNEGWLLRLVLHHASQLPYQPYPLSFQPGSTWFSEALLPTAFKPRFQSDFRGETRTNADGVIGHILIGAKGKADLELRSDATQFSVIEAKIHSHLSKGTQHSPYFDQAARSVACMAESLRKSKTKPELFTNLNFLVLAPQIEIPKLISLVQKEHVQSKAAKRVSEYDGKLDPWYQEWFEPTLEKISLQAISWEEIIDWFGQQIPELRQPLIRFYEQCLYKDP